APRLCGEAVNEVGFTVFGCESHARANHIWSAAMPPLRRTGWQNDPMLFPALLLAALPLGHVVEKVACAAHPEITYALYLPAAYTPERKWPILIALDAGKQALDPMNAFRETAERHGVIVVSSWDSQSDTDSAPSVAAVRAMWDDIHERFNVD